MDSSLIPTTHYIQYIKMDPLPTLYNIFVMKI